MCQHDQQDYQFELIRRWWLNHWQHLASVTTRLWLVISVFDANPSKNIIKPSLSQIIVTQFTAVRQVRAWEDGAVRVDLPL